MAPPRRWIRLDVGWSDSDWVGALEPAGRLAWIELLTYVKRDGTAGVVKALTPAAFGRKVRIPAEDVDAMLNAAKTDGALIEDGGGWIIENWAEYQEVDKTAADRQRRHRADKSRLSPLRRDNRDTPLQPVTGGVTRRVTETETETEQITDEQIGKAQKQPARKPKAPRRWRICPETWHPTDQHRALAAEMHVDLDVEAAKFRDFEFDKPKSDPDRAFSGWLRRAAEFKARNNGASRRNDVSSADERIMQHRQQLEAVDLNASRSVFDDR